MCACSSRSSLTTPSLRNQPRVRSVLTLEPSRWVRVPCTSARVVCCRFVPSFVCVYGKFTRVVLSANVFKLWNFSLLFFFVSFCSCNIPFLNIWWLVVFFFSVLLLTFYDRSLQSCTAHKFILWPAPSPPTLWMRFLSNRHFWLLNDSVVRNMRCSQEANFTSYIVMKRVSE